MPAQNDRGYCTPNHCVVGREREKREKERDGRGETEKEGGREDGLRTHSTHMSVVSGLWAEMDGGRKEGVSG